MADAIDLAREFKRAISMSGVPPKVFMHLLKADGRTFAGWEFRGVPPELHRPVADATRLLLKMVEDRLLPMDIYRLAYLGLETLSERYVDGAPGNDNVSREDPA
jgi:hypothetical protein